MAVSNQEIIYTVKADTGEIEKALATVSKDAEKTADSIDDVGKSMNETGDATNILTNKLDNLTGGAISGFKNAATSTKSFITGLKLTRAAIIATGIGALVVGVVALVQQFSKTEEGARKLAKAFAPVRAVIDVLQQKISALGGAIFKLFSGDFRGAADDFTRALSNQNNEYQRQIDLYRELTDREQALEDARIRQTVATAKTRAEIKELNLVAEDLTKSIDEREAAAERAGQLERALFEERKRIAEEELAIAQARLESSNTTTEDREKVAQLEAEIFTLAQESLELQTTLNNKLNIIRAEGVRQKEQEAELARKEREQAEADAKKKAEEAEKAAQAELAARQKLEDELFALSLSAKEREELVAQQRYDARIAIAGDDEGLIKAATEQLNADLAEIQDKADEQSNLKREQRRAQEDADAEARRQAVLGVAKQTLGALAALNDAFGAASIDRANKIAELEDAIGEAQDEREKNRLINQRNELAKIQDAEGKKQFERGKKIQIAQTLISTYESAVQAFKSLSGIPVVGPGLGVAAAAAATATGLAAIEKIKQQTFEGAGTVENVVVDSPSISATATQATQAPQAPQLDLSFLGEGAVSNAPIQAFVISQDVSNAQQANQQIQEQAQL